MQKSIAKKSKNIIKKTDPNLQRKKTARQIEKDKKEEKSLVVQEFKDAGKKGRDILNKFIVKNLVSDFSKVPRHVKLSLLQVTPDCFVKTRLIDKQRQVLVPYIEYQYAQKCLNFVFNFEVSCKVTRREYIEIKSASGKQCIECECDVEFTFASGKNQIVREVTSSHKYYPTNSTTRADGMKSAISKSWSVVARSFGIGSNLTTIEKKVEDILDNNEVLDGEIVEAKINKQKPKKVWQN